MLNQEERDALRKRLERTEKDLKTELENLAAHEGVEDFGSDIDHGDEEADEAEELGNKIGVMQALKERIEDVEHALAKFEKGNYGVCEKCGMPIEKEILELDPESRYCKSCKAKMHE